ncbi:serine protease [Bradyrhizobium sp. SK17]|nr:serine protease [Bradyrhizobium sp. SK17]
MTALFGSLTPRPVEHVALYLEDRRRPMTGADYQRFSGAGVLFCRDDDGVPQKAAASWLIGSRTLVMMNAHNFLDRQAKMTRTIGSCYFQIAGKNYDFDPDSLQLGIDSNATALHITDDWALARLHQPVDITVLPQPIPSAPQLASGLKDTKVTMVSPAGHANFTGPGSGPSSIESCMIREIDLPTEDAIRRARHDCNDGFGGSGSGLFDEAGHLLAMQSASLDMNRRIAFDIELHYGSALLIEGKLLKAIVAASSR